MLAGFDHLGFISDPHRNFQESRDGLNDHKCTETYKLHSSVSFVSNHKILVPWSLRNESMLYLLTLRLDVLRSCGVRIFVLNTVIYN